MNAPDDRRPDPDARYDSPEFWFRADELPHRPRRVRHGVHGSGRLATAADLHPLLAPPADGALHLPDVTPLVEAVANGSVLQPLTLHGLTLPRELRERHLLCVGTTGAGKTQRFILPALAGDIRDPHRTILAIDAKGGVLHGFMSALAARDRPGQVVHQLNFRQPGRNTILWNPTVHVRDRADSLRLAYCVCTNADTGLPGGASLNETFWVNSSIELLSDVLLALKDDPREEVSLARAKALIDQDGHSLGRYADRHPARPHFSERYPALARRIEGATHPTQQCIAAELATRLQLFGDDNVVRTTCNPNELDLAALVRGGGMLVLEVPEAHAARLRPLTNLLVTQLFAVLLDEAASSPDGRLPRPCTVVLDELGSACGRLPDFDARLSTLRSRGVSVVGAVQTLSQLENLYGKGAGAILDGFCTKIFFGGGVSLADAEYASRLSGVCTVESVTQTTTYAGDHEGERISRTRVPVSRPVLLPEEVARPPVSALLGAPATVFAPGLPPFFAWLPPAYEQSRTASALAEAEQAERARQATLRTELISQEIAFLKKALDWERMIDPVRSWWHDLEARAQATPEELRDLLRGLEGLRRWRDQLNPPGETLLAAFVRVRGASQTASVEGNLALLRYQYLRRWEQQCTTRIDTPGGLQS